MAVTPDDIAVELGRPTPVAEPTRSQWQRWIDRAYLLIRLRAERLGVDYDSLDPEVVDEVVIMAVAAHVERPTSETQVTTAVDDGSVSRQFRSSNGRVTIEDLWWEDLGLADDAAAFSTRLVGEPDACGPPTGGLWWP